MANRLAVVDDTSSRIHYTGGWKFSKHGDEETGLFYGPSVNHTTHDLTSGDGSISFAFNGTYIQPLGTIDTTGGRTAPTWTCLVDGVSIPFNPSINSNFKTTNANLCEAKNLPPGSHVLTLNVTAPSSPFLFSLDWIAYIPPAAIDEADISYIPSVDANVTVGNGWTTDDIGTGTNTSGAQMMFTFTGTRVQAMGLSPPGTPNPRGATYSIDQGSPVAFDIPAAKTQLYNVILLDVDRLSPATHSLNLTFTGNSSETPLEVDHFFVFNVPKPDTSLSATTTSSTAFSTKTGLTGTTVSTALPTPSSSGSTGPVSSDSSTSSTPTGAIVGGVLGGIALLLFLLGVVLFFRRRQRKAVE